MTRDEFISEIRRAIGNPSKDDIRDKDLQKDAVVGLEYAASELGCPVREITLTLTSDLQEYDLPQDFSEMLWVEWNDRILDPATTAKWIRDRIDFRGADASTPNEYAIEQMQVLLYPKPNSTAVTSDSSLKMRYVACPTDIPDAGPEFFNSDLRCAVYFAAMSYMGPRNAENKYSVQIGFCKEMCAIFLEQAKKRHEQRVRHYQGQIAIRNPMNRRRGPAR